MNSSLSPNSFIQLSLPLIKGYIQNFDEYRNSIESIFHKINNVAEIINLLKSESSTYTENGTLKIANALYNAGVFDINDDLEIINPLLLRNFDATQHYILKPALYFYERAVSNNSAKGMYYAAAILKDHYGDIEENPNRCKNLYNQAAQLGDLMALHYGKFTSIELKTFLDKGVIMAAFPIFAHYYKKRCKLRAKKHLKILKDRCSSDELQEVIALLKSDKGVDFSTCISYLTGSTNTFEIRPDKYGRSEVLLHTY